MVSDYNTAMQRWIFGSALPWWAKNGIDREFGGFIEAVTFDGDDAATAFKRTRVTCRQLYVFSHAHTLGWSDGLDLTKRGMSYLIEKAWQGPSKGFARRLSRNGSVLDPTPDLYDHAFVLFALAWRLKATGDREARDWLHWTLDFVEQNLRHPNEGFWHSTPPTGLRQQNPHMHLTEAMLIAHEASGDSRFGNLAKELVALFEKRFFDQDTGTLAEYFTDDLSRASGAEGHIVEPGHQLEWAWILNRCRIQLGVDTASTIRSLVKFAEQHGVDQTSSATYNQIRDDGAPIDLGSRCWPNTERLKSAVALYELDAKDPTPVFTSSGGLLLDRYLATEISGLWIDAFDSRGSAVAETVPASTLYHVFLAFAEVLRTSRSLGQTQA